MNFPNANFSVSGFNDNNFNRINVPSNTFPQNGANVGNPLGIYNPLSTNTQQLMRNNVPITSFQDSFSPNTPMIERIDYSNKNQLIHNNIGDSVLDEHVVEYRLNIDSIDRDIQYYPDPFSYVVKLNPGSSGVYRHEEFIDGDRRKGTTIVESRFDGPPPPYINKEFRNIKYIKLENIILPQRNKLKKNKDGIYDFDSNSNLAFDMYVSLQIPEIGVDRVFTTGENSVRIGADGKFHTPPTPFAIIFLDKLLGTNFYSGTPYYGTKIYKNSLLGNLSQLTIKFYDCYGALLKIDDLMTYDELQEFEFKTHEPFPITDVRHPYNKKIQNHISIIIGVVESQINNNTKFEY
ncbi:hypothetical protein Indivirus_3_43 [Indivirus ILV1]|uniref:Uncharacterized protein n=1 Tax=Indivirus ILV1 TaxID=1977633 RepID=A0A1V0SDT8_9VIRU|nr:hypothetical protein Indivirus_3_43 [Indivirus ILV1]